MGDQAIELEQANSKFYEEVMRQTNHHNRAMIIAEWIWHDTPELRDRLTSQPIMLNVKTESTLKRLANLEF